MKTFYLGTHIPSWLEYVPVPLCVSYNRLRKRKTFPTAGTEWFLDSGAFTNLALHGQHIDTCKSYAAAVKRISNESGKMVAASIQDYMTEDRILKSTGLSITQHQQLTVDNYIDLMNIDNTIPWIPVLQGQTLDDYMRCIDMYHKSAPYFMDAVYTGLGSVCKRQSTSDIVHIVEPISKMFANLHGFGVKTSGLKLVSDMLLSSDSMAWSFAARYDDPLPGCMHDNCANCPYYALEWRDNLLAASPLT